MFDFKYKDASKKTFSDLKIGEFFCHSLPATSIFMKKPHVCDDRTYQAIDLETGKSMTTSETGICISVDVQAVVTEKG